MILLEKSILFLVFIWQSTRFVRNFLGFGNCRYYPNCSDYFIENIKMNGVFLGFVCSLKRLLRCNPFFQGGIDEVKKITV